MLLKAILPYHLSRLIGKMLGQIDNEQSVVLIEDLDDCVSLLGSPPAKLDYFGQGYNGSDDLKLSAILLIDNALEHFSAFGSLVKVDKAA